MTVDDLRQRGFMLIADRLYKAQKTATNQYLIGLNFSTLPEGQRYYQARDLDGNILLIRADNLEL